jgi:hypothetical protein
VRYRTRAELHAALNQLTRFRAVRFTVVESHATAVAPGVATLNLTFEQSLTDSGGGGSGLIGAMSLTAVHTTAGWKWLTGHTSVRREPRDLPLR